MLILVLCCLSYYDPGMFRRYQGKVKDVSKSKRHKSVNYLFIYLFISDKGQLAAI
jgi:hypothetical protein